MPIHFKQKKTNCTIKNVNIRKERHGDEVKILGADIKVEANLSIDFLNTLAVDQDVDWGNFLYNGSGEVRGFGIVPQIKFDREYTGHGATITMKNVSEEDGGATAEFKDVTIMGISAEFLPGRRALVAYTIQVHPQNDQLAILGAALQEAVSVKVFPLKIQTDVEDAAASEAAEEAEQEVGA